MRTLEIALLTLLALTLFSWLLPPRWRPASTPLVRVLLAVMGALAFQTHALLEGPRWQLAPAYAVGFGVLLFAAAGWYRGQRVGEPEPGARVPWLLSAGLALLTLLVLAASGWLAMQLPVLALPAPGGPHLVGVTRFDVADPTRHEIFTADPGDHRIVVVELWYPADPETDVEPRSIGFEEDVGGPILAGLLSDLSGRRVPGFVGRHLALIESHSRPDAAIQERGGPFPVLVFSHGYGLATTRSNSLLMEELASHGYVVASIGHSFETPYVTLEDGRVIAYSLEAIRTLIDEAEAGRADRDAIDGLPAGQERDERLRRHLSGQMRAAESLDIWVADTASVVAALSRAAAGAGGPEWLAGRIDLQRLGVFGMSFGGATAGQFCLRDRRCRAGANLDGFMYGDLVDGTLDQPFMILESGDREFVANAFALPRLRGEAWLARIQGARHADFTDLAVLAPMLRSFGIQGSIDGPRMQTIVNVYVRSFFDHTLRGRGAPELERPSFAEVELSVPSAAQ